MLSSSVCLLLENLREIQEKLSRLKTKSPRIHHVPIQRAIRSVHVKELLWNKYTWEVIG